MTNDRKLPFRFGLFDPEESVTLPGVALLNARCRQLSNAWVRFTNPTEICAGVRSREWLAPALTSTNWLSLPSDSSMRLPKAIQNLI